MHLSRFAQMKLYTEAVINHTNMDMNTWQNSRPKCHLQFLSAFKGKHMPQSKSMKARDVIIRLNL